MLVVFPFAPPPSNFRAVRGLIFESVPITAPSVPALEVCRSKGVQHYRSSSILVGVLEPAVSRFSP